MTNILRLWIVLLALTFPSLLTAQVGNSTIPLISQPELAPYGLQRAWFHQLHHHSANATIQGILLEGGQLFITTSDAFLHVLDSETGHWLWSRSVGKRGFSLNEPAVNSRVVAVHNNLEVFLFNRRTGKLLLQIPLPISAAAPCELSEHYLYVPMDNQTMLVYPLRQAHAPQPIEDPGTDARQIETHNDPVLARIVEQFEEARRLLIEADPPWVEDDCFVLDSTHRVPITVAMLGTVSTKPLLLSQFYDWVLDEEENPTHEVDWRTHQEFVTWVIEEGFLVTARLSELSETGMALIYRVDSIGQTFFVDQTRSVRIDRPRNKELVSRPTQTQLFPLNVPGMDHIIFPDVIVTGGRSSNIFAIDARTGNVRWQYPTLGQMLEPIAVIGRDIYAPTATGIMHALDLMTGEQRWAVRNVSRFVAASQNRVYVLDQRERLVALDRASGASIFVYDVRRFDHVLFNLETDQIFLLTDNGLIQCLRERQFAEGEDAPSLRHRISAKEFAEAAHSGEMPELWWMEE